MAPRDDEMNGGELSVAVYGAGVTRTCAADNGGGEGELTLIGFCLDTRLSLSAAPSLLDQ